MKGGILWQLKIKVEDNWKELSKNLVDQCNNYNDFQKAILKCFLESYYEGRKNTIIQNDIQAKYIETIIKGNNNSYNG